MNKLNNYKNIYLYTSLVVISFLINFYVASKGVFPVDTFIHYDFGYRILLGDDPVKDYWIVHGFIIDGKWKSHEVWDDMVEMLSQ